MTVFMGVPTMYAKLLAEYDAMPVEAQKRAAAAARSLRLAVSGSSACPVPIMQRWQQLTGQFLLERCEASMSDRRPFPAGKGGQAEVTISLLLPATEMRRAT